MVHFAIFLAGLHLTLAFLLYWCIQSGVMHVEADVKALNRTMSKPVDKSIFQVLDETVGTGFAGLLQADDDES